MDNKPNNSQKRKRSFENNDDEKKLCLNKNNNVKDVPINTKRHRHKEENDNRTLDVYAPTSINVYQYAEARAYEIKNLKHAISEAKTAQNSLAFQMLPRHMRRRAASHDPRRLPKYLRAKALEQMEKVPPKKKMPSRKYKRRPKNLLEDFERRSRLHSWLKTHIWHAKRFKMVDKWGYKIAEQPCDKSFRATYRASANCSLLQDKSYLEFIELIGEKEKIIQGLRRMVNVETGEMFDIKNCVSGMRYVENMVYRCDTYPLYAIGPVKFLWIKATSNKAVVMMIVHPSISIEIISQLQACFHELEIIKENVKQIDSKIEQVDSCVKQADSKMVEVDSKKEPIDSNMVKSCFNINADQLSKLPLIAEEKMKSPAPACGTDPALKTDEDEIVADVIVRTTDKSIQLKHHKLNFVFLSLTGPLSLSILQNTLTGFNADDSTKDFKTSAELWRCSTDEQIRKSNYMLYNLTVKDPRLQIPCKKQNPFNNTKKKREGFCTQPLQATTSLLWDKTTREKVEEEKMTDWEINELKRNLLVTTEHDLKSLGIPIVVLQRPSEDLNSPFKASSKTYKGGFDLILPSGWAMPFWIALVYQGARVGGLRENENIDLEALTMSFPKNFPDTEAGLADAQAVEKEKLEKHYRYPPDKRRNFDVIGINHPFLLPLSELVIQWKTNILSLLKSESELCNVDHSEKNVYVLRNRNFLLHLKKSLEEKTSHEEKQRLIEQIFQHQNSLVAVRLFALQSGTPDNNATLCIPFNTDIAKLRETKQDSLQNTYYGPLEPKHRGLKHVFPYICKSCDISRHNARYIGVNTRWILGYIQSGRYSLSRGKGAGVGYISMLGLAYLLSSVDDANTLLFRNTNTLQYRFCNFEILT